MHQDHNAPPVNPLPPVLTLLVVTLVAAEGFLWLQSLGFLGGVPGIDGRSALLDDFAIPGLMQSWMFETGNFDGQYLVRYLTFSLVSGNFTGTVFTAVFVLALGNFVSRALGAWRFLTLYFAPAILGAVAYGFIGTPYALTGGFTGVFGLIGAFTWLMWAGVIRHPVGAASPFALIGILVAFRLVMSPLFGWQWDTLAEWVAFSSGFGLTFVLVPGGIAQLLKLLRKR